MSGETRDARVWRNTISVIRSTLPEWAQYAGYGTYALAGYAYGSLFAVISLMFFTDGVAQLTVFTAVLSLICFSLAGYYRGAAKLRVDCSQCGESARGKSKCPHCGGPTFKGSDSE